MTGCIACLASCGGSTANSPEDEVLGQVDAFWGALVDGDGSAVCALAGPHAQAELKRPNPETTVTCEEGVALLGGTEVAGDEFDTADVEIEGSSASVESESGWCVYVQELDGTWLVAALPVPAEIAELQARPCRPKALSFNALLPEREDRDRNVNAIEQLVEQSAFLPIGAVRRP